MASCVHNSAADQIVGSLILSFSQGGGHAAPAARFRPRNTKRWGRALHLSGCGPHLLFSRLGCSGLNPSGLDRRGPILYSAGVLNPSGFVRSGQSLPYSAPPNSTAQQLLNLTHLAPVLL